MSNLKPDPPTPPPTLPLLLKAHLSQIHQSPCPPIPNPPTCKKRASVALIIRIRPTYPTRATYDPSLYHTLLGEKGDSFQPNLDTFFAQTWVATGDPEILFIKRSTRVGDRWTGHIALPGGKRELGDVNDKETSVRETREETGLELGGRDCLFVGNLPERVVTSTWGKKPLMVLCPYIFLLLRHDIPPLMLQPTEVHSAHWVSVRALFADALRTHGNCDVSERLNKYNSTAARYFLRLLFGQMRFSAKQLMPTESLWCNSFLPSATSPPSPTSHIRNILLGISAATTTTNPPPPPLKQHPQLLLWGLTLGMVADFLGPLSSGVPHFWTWPTFSSWDYRLAVWLFTYSFRARKLRELRSAGGSNDRVDFPMQLSRLNEATFCASSTSGKQEVEGKEKREQEKRISVVGIMLDGYLDLAAYAAALVLFFRLGLTIAFLFACIKYYAQIT